MQIVMGESHEFRTEGSRIIGIREAMRALREGLPVWASETTEGDLGLVEAIDPLRDGERLTPAFTVRFVGGRSRVCLEDHTFRL